MNFELLENRNLLTSVTFVVPELDRNSGNITAGTTGDVINAAGTEFIQDGVEDLAIVYEGFPNGTYLRKVYIVPGNSPAIPAEGRTSLQPFNAGDGSRLPFLYQPDEKDRFLIDLNGDGLDDQIVNNFANGSVELSVTINYAEPKPIPQGTFVTFVNPPIITTLSVNQPPVEQHFQTAWNAGDVINSAGSTFGPDGIDDLLINHTQPLGEQSFFLIPGGAPLLTDAFFANENQQDDTFLIELEPFLAGINTEELNGINTTKRLPFSLEQQKPNYIDLNNDGSPDTIVNNQYETGVKFGSTNQQLSNRTGRFQ